MAETTTPNYGWTMPDPGASANTWGSTLNATTQKVDAQVFVNQQGLVPVGSVTMFAGATAPTNWLICDGRSLSTAAPYDKLFAAIQYAFGGSGANFNLPNLQGVFPLGAGASNPLGSKAGSYSYTIGVNNLPPHAHPITDLLHSHTASQNAHSHNASQDAHTHNASQDAHSHGIPLDLVNPSGGGLTNGGASFGLAGGQRTDTQQPAVHIDVQQPAVHIDTQQPGVGVNPSGTGLSTTQNAGGGAAMSIVPSYVALNYIIRYA